MEVNYIFRYTTEHLLTSMLRYREQTWWRRPFVKYRWPLVALFGICAIGAVSYKFQILTIVTIGVIGALVLGWPIDSWLASNRFKKSPYYNDDLTVELSEEGFNSAGGNNKINLTWDAFTKARRFPDGLLLFQGPYVCNWLPDAKLESPATAEMAAELVRSKVSDYRNA